MNSLLKADRKTQKSEGMKIAFISSMFNLVFILLFAMFISNSNFYLLQNFDSIFDSSHYPNQEPSKYVVKGMEALYIAGRLLQFPFW